MAAVKPKNSVASSLLVNDRTLIVPSPPITMTASGNVVWIALANGSVEVRNTRTGETLRRFDPVLAAPVIPPSQQLLANVEAAKGKQSSFLSALASKGRPFGSKGEAPSPSSVVVRSLLSVPTASGNCYIWLGLSNGCIEVHEGGDLLHDGTTSVPMGDLIYLLRKHSAGVVCLAEFGGYVYSGSEDSYIVQWRSSHGIYVRVFSSQNPHEGAVRCLYAEGNAVVSGSDDCTVKVWDVGSGTMRLTGYFHARSGGVSALCRVGECMWSGDAKGQIVRWHLRTCEAASIDQPHQSGVLSLCRIGDRVYSGSADGTLGIFEAQTGRILHHITDQSQGWLTSVVCPAALSRFVVWTSSLDGAVRCWYQDEYCTMAPDEVRFNDPSWYESGSTPYREFRAAVGQRIQLLQSQLEQVKSRDNQAMDLLQRCSTFFGGGGGPEVAAQQARLQSQLNQTEERCRQIEQKLSLKRDEVANIDKDISLTLALLQNARSELNVISPGYLERIMVGLPEIPTDEITAYTSAVSTDGPLGSNGTATTSIPLQPPPPSTYATLVAPSTGAVMPLPSIPPPPPPNLPGVAAGIPPPSLPNFSVPIPPPPPAVPLSSLGVGGPLLPPPPPPIPPGLPTFSSGGGGDGGPPLLLATSTALPTLGVGSVPGEIPLPPPPSVPQPPQLQQQTLGLAAEVVPIVGGAAATADAATSAAGQQHFEKQKLSSIAWTNPHVGNYIQRRYYGATPSLRTPDLMKQERQRGRMPIVPVVPLVRASSIHRSDASKKGKVEGEK